MAVYIYAPVQRQVIKSNEGECLLKFNVEGINGLYMRPSCSLSGSKCHMISKDQGSIHCMHVYRIYWLGFKLSQVIHEEILLRNIYSYTIVHN